MPGPPGLAQRDSPLLPEVAKRYRIQRYRKETSAGSKFKPNDSEKELIGITDGILFWASESGVDNSTDDAGKSGLHLTLFDTSTRADSAQIKLLNDSGSTQYIVAAAIKAKPIVRLSGEQGFLHDSFVDYQDIFLNGENTFTFGNNFVVTKAQLEQLADYYAKTLGTIATSGNPKAKHIYAVSVPGRCWWFEPGEWYTLQVGGSGQREYIDSVVECYDMTVDAQADSLGVTNIAFREIEQNWVKDSNAIARFLATGDPRWKPNNFGRVVVAAKDYLGVADYYCDGTADQTEIQAAIDYLANAFGGGLVELVNKQFTTAAVIDVKDSIILGGQGANTIIEKNCNDYAIDIQGTSGTYIDGAQISNLQLTRNSADTNSKALLHLQYCRNVILENLIIEDSYSDGVIIENCENIKFVKCVVNGAAVDGIVIKSIIGLLIFGSLVSGCTRNGLLVDMAENTNLISNSDCEAETDPAITGDAGSSNGDWERSNTQAHGGTYSYWLRLTGTSGYWSPMDSEDAADLHELDPEYDYRFSFWVYPAVGDTNTGIVTIKYSTDGSTFGYVDTYNINPANGTWTQYERDFSLPANTTGVYIKVLFGPGTTGDDIFFDDIYLYKTEFLDGGIVIEASELKTNDYGCNIRASGVEFSRVTVADNTTKGIYITGGDGNRFNNTVSIRNGTDSVDDNFHDGGTNTHTGI